MKRSAGVDSGRAGSGICTRWRRGSDGGGEARCLFFVFLLRIDGPCFWLTGIKRGKAKALHELSGHTRHVPIGGAGQPLIEVVKRRLNN